MKKLMKIIPVVLVMCLVLTNVFAVAGGVPTGYPTAGDGSDTLEGAASNIWSTILTIVQILAFCAIIFAGVRYMFASADQKADIKKGMGYLALGGILVFAASTVVSFLMTTADEIF